MTSSGMSSTKVTDHGLRMTGFVPRRTARGLGVGAGVTFLLIHAVHVTLASAAPAAFVAAARFICHIP